MHDHERLLFAYEVDVHHPDVSGMEHLDMLLTRSRLADAFSELTPQQKKRLEKADQVLFRDAHQFYTAIAQIANLKRWREDENAPPSHWWWYLDVVTELPALPETTAEFAKA